MEARRIVIYLQDENRFYIDGLMAFLKQFFDQQGVSVSFTQYFSDKQISLSFVSQHCFQQLDNNVGLPYTLQQHPLFVLYDLPHNATMSGQSLDDMNHLPLSRYASLETLQHALNAQLQRIYIDRSRPAPMRNNVENLDHLTLREKETLRYLARGLNNAAIARCLKISEKTVSSHKRNIMTKLSICRGPDFNYWLIKQRYFH